MNCVRIPNGILCGSFPRRKPCAWCSKPGTRLCDQQFIEGGTCDAPMCDAHAYRPAVELDFCPHHAHLHRPPVEAQTPEQAGGLQP